MIQRLYVNNFRCLENFELPIAGRPSSLLIGRNGSGKSTVRFALEVFQSIARGTNQVSQLLKPGDFSRGRSEVPMRFEIEAELDLTVYQYTLALELPAEFKELQIVEEKFSVNGAYVYSRKHSEVDLHTTSGMLESKF
nr:AAA family ATPase [Armatimonadota bacterium]